MNGKSAFRILLDITMLVLYSLLMFDTGAGEFFHEAAGIAVGAMFILHVVLNWKMFRGLFNSVSEGNRSPVKLGLLISDLVLPVAMALSVFSGILIARELFVIEVGGAWELIYNVHNISSWAGFAAMLLHTALHFGYFRAIAKNTAAKGFMRGAMKAAGAFFSGLAALAMCGLILYTSLSAGENVELSVVSKPSSATSSVESAASSSVTSSADSSAAESAASSETSQDAVSEDTVMPEVTAPSSSSKDEDKQSATISSGSSGDEEIPSLAEYLSRLTCSGCGRHCPLSSPHCGKGEARAQQAETEYYETYQTEN